MTKLNTKDQEFITLLPPNYDNKTLELNDMKVTYFVSKCEKKRINQYLRSFDKQIIIPSTNIKNFLYNIGKENDLEVYEGISYPKDYVRLMIYTPDADYKSEIILKTVISKKILFVNVYHKRENPLDIHFLENFF